MKFQDYIKNKRSNIVLTDSQEKIATATAKRAVEGSEL